MKHSAKPRCFGNQAGQSNYADYHDYEWGIPVYDDRLLFEMLSLEGAQAGLSWETVLKKRQGYIQAFHNFDVQKVSNMPTEELDQLCHNPNIIRHRLKIYSVRKNAQIFLSIQHEFGSFSEYLWQFVNHKPIINHWETFEHVPTKTQTSDLISKDLKKRGMSFVGSIIIYAYMQAVGLVCDHLTTCWRYGITKK